MSSTSESSKRIKPTGHSVIGSRSGWDVVTIFLPVDYIREPRDDPTIATLSPARMLELASRSLQALEDSDLDFRGDPRSEWPSGFFNDVAKSYYTELDAETVKVEPNDTKVTDFNLPDGANTKHYQFKAGRTGYTFGLFKPSNYIGEESEMEGSDQLTFDHEEQLKIHMRLEAQVDTVTGVKSISIHPSVTLCDGNVERYLTQSETSIKVDGEDLPGLVNRILNDDNDDCKREINEMESFANKLEALPSLKEAVNTAAQKWLEGTNLTCSKLISDPDWRKGIKSVVPLTISSRYLATEPITDHTCTTPTIKYLKRVKANVSNARQEDTEVIVGNVMDTVGQLANQRPESTTPGQWSQLLLTLADRLVPPLRADSNFAALKRRGDSENTFSCRSEAQVVGRTNQEYQSFNGSTSSTAQSSHLIKYSSNGYNKYDQERIEGRVTDHYLEIPVAPEV